VIVNGRRHGAAWPLALVAALLLQSCGPRSAATGGETDRPPIKPVATIRELMDSTVDPAADGLWDSVATIASEAGVDRREPRTDAQWLAVRRHAMTLIEAMNLAMMEGRRAAPAGTKPGLGELSPRQIDDMIAANRPEFNSFALAVRDNAQKALAAIDRRDARALFTIGSDLDESCESCHVTFWYPNSARPGT